MWALLMELLALGGLLSGIHWKVNLGVMSLFFYYSNERSFLHRELTEMIYWALMYAWFGFIVLHDLPILQLGSFKYIFGSLADLITACVFSLCGIWAHTTAQNDRLQSSIQELDLRMLVDKQHVETGAARFTVYCIQNLISQRSTSSGQLQRLVGKLREMAMGKIHWLEEEVLQALESCCHGSDTSSPPDDLLYVLNCSEVDLPQFLALISSDQVIHLIRKYVHHMDTVTKTRLVDALQRQHDFYVNRLQQELVVELLESTTGDELRMMKDILDEGGDFYNLHKLVFHDLDPEMYSKALNHIQKEGRHLAKQYDPGKAPIKIVSDVDDTLYGSGGHFPAGCDHRFPGHQVYPGVLALFREITAHRAAKQSEKPPKDEEQNGEQAGFSSVFTRFLGYRVHDSANPVWIRVGRQWKEISVSETETVAQLQERVRARALEDQLLGEGDVSFHPPQIRVWSNLVFLSARPHAYKDYLESKSYKLFRRLRKSGKLHCMPTLLAGKLKSSGLAFIFGVVLLYPRNTLAGGVLQVFLCWFCLGLLPMIFPFTFLAFAVLVTWSFYATSSLRKESRVNDVWRPVGEDKIKSFVEYRQLYSECSMLFFGDNGQGDLMCAERLTGMNGSPSEDGVGGMVSAAFIHQVADPAEQLSELEKFEDHQQAKEEYASRGIYLFRTYVGAAIHVYNLGFISQEGLFRVCTEAVQDMVRLRIRYLGRAERRPWKEVVNEMNDDVDRANELLRDSGLQIGKVPNSAGVNLERPGGASPTFEPMTDVLEKVEKSMEEGREAQQESTQPGEEPSEESKSEDDHESPRRSEHEQELQPKSQNLRLPHCFMRRKHSGGESRKSRLSHCPSLGEFSFEVPPIGRC